MAHWYTDKGAARHTMPTKPGAKYARRGTSITDARKLRLYPSSTGIIDGCSSSFDYFRELELCGACYELRPFHDEEAAVYSKRVLSQSRDSEAATIGTNVHAAIEQYFLGNGMPDTLTLRDDWVLSGQKVIGEAVRIIEGLDMEIVATEKVTVNKRHGYAGTLDMGLKSDTHYGVLDIKTLRTEKGKAIKPKQDHPVQISSYVASEWGQELEIPIGDAAIGYNLYISSTEPGRCELVAWNADVLKQSFVIFQKMLELWFWRHNYNPTDK